MKKTKYSDDFLEMTQEVWPEIPREERLRMIEHGAAGCERFGLLLDAPYSQEFLDELLLDEIAPIKYDGYVKPAP